MSIKALVAVRSGSVRVKNIRPFAGSSLLEIKLMQLKKISGLDGIVVNSNEVCLKRISRSITSWRISPAVRIYRTLIMKWILCLPSICIAGGTEWKPDIECGEWKQSASVAWREFIKYRQEKKII